MLDLLLVRGRIKLIYQLFKSREYFGILSHKKINLLVHVEALVALLLRFLHGRIAFQGVPILLEYSLFYLLINFDFFVTSL
jgi:hypothetical protein